MRILSIVAEYNPFHNGHKYHIEKSIDQTQASHTIAIVSGSFVQRGEPSIIDKWKKAEIAIHNGIDLVIELPFVYSVQTAELFAYGAIEILDSLNCVDFISFGSEHTNLSDIEDIAKILMEEPLEYLQALKTYLDLGNSYPKARELALKSYISMKNINLPQLTHILNGSNNILAIEYIKALNKLSSKIKPIIIKRQGNDYKDKTLGRTFSSATSIRHSLYSKNNLDLVSKYMPIETIKTINNNPINHLDNYIDIFNYLNISMKGEDLEKYMDLTDDLKNRILNINTIFKNSDDLINSLSTKRYTKTRIQRTYIHMLNSLDKENILNLYSNRTNYIRILASNKKGFEIINKIKKKSSIQIINRFSELKEIKDQNILKFLSYEEKATNLYFLAFKNNSMGLDYLKSPYIKKQ